MSGKWVAMKEYARRAYVRAHAAPEGIRKQHSKDSGLQAKKFLRQTGDITSAKLIYDD